MPVKNPLGLGPSLLPGGGFPGSYLNKVLSIERASLIGCWLQNELSGSVSFDSSDQGNNGAYTGVTLGQPGVPGMGMTSPFYDGANDFNNFYSAGLNTDFNGQEATVLVWLKVSAVGVWTSGVANYGVAIKVNGSNRIHINIPSTNSRLAWFYNAGGTAKQVEKAPLSELGWMCLVMTVSKTGDELRAYYKGVQEGSTQTSLGTWAGALSATETCIGALSTTPSGSWSGNIGPVALWNKALTPAQIAYLSTV